MERIEEVTQAVNKFFKDNYINFELTPDYECLNYSIDLGTFPLCFQIEFWNKKDEELYSNEYCVLQSWIPLSDYGDDQITIEVENITSLEFLITEIGSIIPKYQDYLRLINKVEKHISNIQDLFDELDIEFNKSINFNSFIN